MSEVVSKYLSPITANAGIKSMKDQKLSNISDSETVPEQTVEECITTTVLRVKIFAGKEPADDFLNEIRGSLKNV